MLDLQANVARFQFECANVDPSTFQVVAFRGREEISQPYVFELDLASTDPDVSFADVINHSASLTLTAAAVSVPLRGLVVGFEQSGKTADHFAYRAVLRPHLWRLSLSRQSRIFQNVTTDEIVSQVLTGAGLSSTQVRFELSQALPGREYCVQYQESDLDFICRLLEHDGIFYFFDHSDEPETIVFTDSPESVKPIAGDDILVYDDLSTLIPDRETISEVRYREDVVTGKVLLKDYNHRSPSDSLQVEADADPNPGTQYDYGDHYRDAGEGQRLARIRSEELAAQRRVITGRSDCVALRSGHRFAMERYHRADLNQEYLVVAVEHAGSQSKAMGLKGVTERDGESEAEYTARVRAIPASVPFRPPRRTPWPRLPGIMNARIETGGGDYAFIDEDGSYHVKMPFDLSSTGDGQASRPIRMAQPYSGPRYGIHFPNHANTEMIWACVDGNPDRPVGLGTVPNAENTSPAVSENKMQNVIRTFSGNEIILDDTIDEAQIKLTTPDANNMLFDDKDDRILLATTNKHQIVFDDKNKRIELKSTDGHFFLVDDEKKKITVQSKDGHWISINDDDQVMTVSDEKGENRFVIDIGKKKLTIESKKGDIDLLAPQGNVLIKAKTLNTETTGDTKMKAANIKTEAQSDHEMKAMNVISEAKKDLKQKGMMVTSEAQMEHSIKGLNVKSEGAAQNELSGALVNVKASGINTIQGSLVKIN